MTAAITSTELRDRSPRRRRYGSSTCGPPPNSRPRISTAPSTCRSMCSTTTARRSPNSSIRTKTSCWCAARVNAPPRPASCCRARASPAECPGKRDHRLGGPGVRRQPRRSAMGSGTPGPSGRGIHRAFLGAREHRGPTTQMAGRGDRRRPDVRRRLQHLRDGHRAVEIAVQPRRVNRRGDGPLAARDAGGIIKITASLARTSIAAGSTGDRRA